MAPTSPARDAILAAVAALPLEVDVEAYARNATITAPTVMVRLDRVTKRAPWRDYDAALLVIVPNTVEDADDELDALLEDVLQAIDAGDGPLRWTTADRATFEGAFPCYEVTLTVPVVPQRDTTTTTTQE